MKVSSICCGDLTLRYLQGVYVLRNCVDVLYILWDYHPISGTGIIVLVDSNQPSYWDIMRSLNL